MSGWHPPIIEQVGLRVAGMALMAGVHPESRWLHAMVLRHPAITPVQCLLGALCFLSASLGAALLLMGPYLWKPVTVAERWRRYDG